MNVYEEYIQYFRHLAKTHLEICHLEDTGKFGFYRINTEELLAGFRTQIREKGTFLALVNYNWKGLDDDMSIVEGGFIIAKWHEEGNYDAMADVMADTEQTVKDFIERIRWNSENGHPLFFQSLNSISSFDVMPAPYVGDQTYSGWLVTFSWHVPAGICIEQYDLSKWKN